MIHLVHPALVHFAVAFIATGAVVEAYGLLRDREEPRRFGETLLVAGTLTLVAVIASGYFAANSITLPEGAAGTLDAHERNGWFLLAMLVLMKFWKGWVGGTLEGANRKAYAVALLAVAAWLAYSAWLGGTLVYTYGVGVGQG